MAPRMTAPFPASALVPGLDPGTDLAAPLILALPKGRILSECGALLAHAGVNPAADYADEDSRRLRFPTDDPRLDVVHLSGAMELAPGLGLSRLIVDLVQTGSTLKANGLVETEVIAQVTSRLIVIRTALKTQPEVIGAWIARFRAALGQG